MWGGVVPAVVDVVVVVVPVAAVEGDTERTIRKVAPTKRITMARTTPSEG
jgi:hypothetical protein